MNILYRCNESTKTHNSYNLITHLFKRAVNRLLFVFDNVINHM